MRGPASPEPALRVGLALALLAIDPVGLGGLWLRARVGPVRAAVLAALGAFGARLHPGMDDATLLGGTDLAATLSAGRMVTRPGLLAGDRFTLTMAERCPPALAARLAQRLDAGGAALLALDEAAGPDEGLPPALADRLGLFLDLDGLVWSDLPDLAPDPARLTAARAALPHVDSAGAVLPLTGAAATMGIGSARAVLMALACARAAAAWRGARAVEEADLRTAAELVLAPRGLTPQEASPPAPDQTPPPPPEPQDRPEAEADAQALDIPPELLVEAARAALPPGLIERLQAGRASRQAAGSGAGALRKALTRGRPLPARPGRPGGAARVDLIATLRQAAPWQPVRRRQTGRHLTILPGDIRLKRYQDRTDRVLILAVDASGSLAMTRLAEAKGAVERLLAEAYVTRDHVALVAFRGAGAELLLPPTRSLVQTKRRLAGLPGGGGTPLAAGLRAALEAARQARARGLAPALAVLTDGRANVSLSGSGGRPQAMEDSHAMARALAAERVPSLVIDTGMRPSPALADLARSLGADLVTLPRRDDAGLAGALSLALNRAGGAR
jgi:magnesium chelatase subunit D